jgi:hypothetical protein
MRSSLDLGRCLLVYLAIGSYVAAGARAADPDPKGYWEVRDLRPGMKGVGKTVMVGTRLEEFEAEVLGVLIDVNPGRDMVLVRLSGCNLEHAGIIQGMSGSPIYIDGKMLGAVAYAWEFAKDPIAGVTPFAQMVEYVRSTDRRLAHEGPGDRVADLGVLRDRDQTLVAERPAANQGLAVSGGGLAGMRPIATPLSARGFGPRSLSMLTEHLGPWNMSLAAGGGALDEIIAREGGKPLEPGSPMSVALVTGDFDVSGIGTVTHVEGNRVYGFGHPMMSLGSCELPLMTGYIHTVYPRASVSMKMGSPLKTVGVLDSDVSTAVSGRLGELPDMLPMTVRVKVGSFSESKSYDVQIVREPNLMASLVMTVLTGALDTEGNLPDELTATLDVTIRPKDRPPIVIHDVLSGSRYSGPMGGSAMFGPVANVVNLLVRNAFQPVRIESIEATIGIEEGRRLAQIESLRLVSDRVTPGSKLRAIATLKPHKGDRSEVSIEGLVPEDMPEGTYEVAAVDLSKSLQRRFRNEPYRLEPRDLDGVIETIRYQIAPSRQAIYLHLPEPERGLAVEGQALPSLPGSVRGVLISSRRTPPAPVKSEQVSVAETDWVIEGAQTLRFVVAKDVEHVAAPVAAR